MSYWEYFTRKPYMVKCHVHNNSTWNILINLGNAILILLDATTGYTKHVISS